MCLTTSKTNNNKRSLVRCCWWTLPSRNYHKKIIQVVLLWPTLHKYCKSQLMKCDNCQRLGRPLKQHEMPLMSINPSLTFEIWAIYFVGPIPKPSHGIGARYIITALEYVAKWGKEEPIESCTK